MPVAVNEKGIMGAAEVRKVRRELTDAQRAELHEQLFDATVEIFDTEDEKKKIVADFNKKLKDLRDATREAAQSLRLGYAEREESVTAYPDLDERVMRFYDAEGRVVGSRRLKPHEHQERIEK